MRKVYGVINALRGALIVAVLGFIIIIGSVQIVLRYVPGLKPLSWVDEIMRYLNIWVVFLAASIGVRESTHLSMDYFLQKLFSPAAIRIVKKTSEIVIILSLLLLIYHGTLRVVANTNAVIQSLPISISFFYLAIPVGCALILLDYVIILIHGSHPYSRKGG